MALVLLHFTLFFDVDTVKCSTEHFIMILSSQLVLDGKIRGINSKMVVQLMLSPLQPLTTLLFLYGDGSGFRQSHKLPHIKYLGIFPTLLLGDIAASSLERP
jgi:hypothetical protein